MTWRPGDDRAPEGAVTTASVRRGDRGWERDAVAVEAPLELRLDGHSVAVVMRSPGHDFELAVGFLLAEALLEADEITGVSWCRPPGEAGPTNVVQVSSRDGVGGDRARGRSRSVTVSSACGLCGRTHLESVHQTLPTPRTPPPLTADRWKSAVTALETHQPAFEATGMVHGALLHADNRVLCAYEDIGRHNAVDKCLGRMALHEAPMPEDAILVVSGRISFEIIQKAARARVGAVVGLGAATDLAISLAREARMHLVGFGRGEGTLYVSAVPPPGRQSTSSSPAATVAARLATKR